MLARSQHQWQTGTAATEVRERRRRRARTGGWRADLRAVVRDLASLCRELDLDPRLATEGAGAAADHPLRVPRAWLDLIERGNPDDPLLRQILPTAAETAPQPCFGPDPVGDLDARQSDSLLGKYQGRALLLVTGSCAIHCRYCFRRWFPFAASLNHPDRARVALAHIKARPDISEVILSGGDPLLLNDHSLHWLLRELDAITHLKRIRLHSRVPIALPSRINADLCALLGCGRLPRVLVVQTNHPRELGEGAAEALARLRAAGIHVLNQSVLLRGVNDAPAVLQELSERLFALGVLPYYLHRLDRVAGSAHFDLPLAECARLATRLRARLPGYLLPRMVSETPGAQSKTPLDQMLATAPAPNASGLAKQARG